MVKLLTEATLMKYKNVVNTTEIANNLMQDYLIIVGEVLIL